MKRAPARRSLPLSSAVTTRVRDIERVREKRERERERERKRERDCASVRLRGALDAEDWMLLERSSATKIHFKTRLKETGRRARHERRDVTVATYQ